MRYLSVEEVLLIHEFQIRRYGGMAGIRSIELLESSLYRPQVSFGGRELYKTTIEKAACLIHSIIKNHPFVEGNKRTAMVSGTVFLKTNGYSVDITQEEYLNISLDIADNKLDLKELIKILKNKCQKL